MYNARVFVVGRVWKHSRIYLFRKNMVRLGWGSYAFKQARMGMSTPETDLRRRFSEQLNAHSEQLNATMRHLGTESVAFTLGRHQFENHSKKTPHPSTDKDECRLGTKRLLGHFEFTCLNCKEIDQSFLSSHGDLNV